MTITSERGLLMLDYLPPYYAASRVMTALLRSQGAEFDRLNLALNDTLDQFFVETATWGLDTWETELALSVAPPGMSYADRRLRILAILGGDNTATLARVKALIETLYAGVVHVIEDYAAYRVYIRFYDPPGIPTNFTAIEAAVRAMVPAHLDLYWIFASLTWNALDALNLTWDQLDALNLTWNELEVLA
jgi:hypothetical protein